MKLSGTAALYTQLKELENAVQVTKRQIALAEELLAEAPAKKTKSRKPRTPKALPYDGVIGQGYAVETNATQKPNGVGLDEAESVR